MPLLVLAASFALTANAGAAVGWLDEGKLGIIKHDIVLGGDHKESGPDVNGELLFVSPALLQAIGSPRPHLGVSVNTHGATSYAYTGLTWTFTPFGGPVFFGIGLGGAVHDGELNRKVPNRKELGSRALFHESLELGAHFADALSISLFLDHISNANLAPHNQGITNVGLRGGFKF